jgi:hypothetical protein
LHDEYVVFFLLHDFSKLSIHLFHIICLCLEKLRLIHHVSWDELFKFFKICLGSKTVCCCSNFHKVDNASFFLEIRPSAVRFHVHQFYKYSVFSNQKRLIQNYQQSETFLTNKKLDN